MHDFLQLRNYYGIGFAAVTVITVALIIWLQFFGVLQEAQPETNRAVLSINGASIVVGIADTPAQRMRGLSGIRELPEGQGLLFVFDSLGRHGIWMKDMQFSIDIMWLDERMTIVGIQQDASPASYPETFKPPQPARYVLEVASGFVERHGIENGDRALFRKAP